MKTREEKMANKYKIETEKGYRAEVRLPHDTTEYALKLLTIFNNVRVNDELINVHNFYDDRVWITATCKDELIHWVETQLFLELLRVEEVEIVRVFCEPTFDDEYNYVEPELDMFVDC